jgi:glycosyltransferase involved in cell wall biosynthesis
MTVPRVAVLIPCFNEAHTIADVVSSFRKALPAADLYVYDNNSDDGTADIAAAAGALVRREPLQGKGNVVRRMFADIEADAYVLVDGDGTYDASAAPRMIDMLFRSRLDMVTGVRVTEVVAAYRPGHRFGNALLTGMVRWIFGNGTTDMLSGYRILSWRFVKSFPALAGGFETETELTVHALGLRLPVGETLTNYRERPAGSTSKLNTWRDGFRILRTIVMLTQRERPLLFFSLVAALLMTAAIILALPLLETFLETGLVPRQPTALLATSLTVLAALSVTCGLILDTVSRGRLEMKRLAYLAMGGHGASRQTVQNHQPQADGLQPVWRGAAR